MGTDSEKLFSIYKRNKKHAAVGSTTKCERRVNVRESGGSYQVSNDFLEELGTFLHLILWPSQLNYITFLSRVREIDNDLEDNKIILIKLN